MCSTVALKISSGIDRQLRLVRRLHITCTNSLELIFYINISIGFHNSNAVV